MTPQELQRRYSFFALIGIVLLMGVLFFQIVRPFLMPLILAAVLAMLVRPFYKRVVKWFRGRRYWAAAFVTFLVLVLGLAPLSIALFLAGRELFAAAELLMEVDWSKQPLTADVLQYIERNLSDDAWARWQESSRGAMEDFTRKIYDRTYAIILNVIQFIVGVCIVAFALFYFLAEGRSMMRAVRKVSPMADEDEKSLVAQFEKVCRGVVISSVVCGLVQAILAGIGFAVLRVDNVWLLSGITMFSALIPFMGAAAVWITVSVSLAFQGQYVSATILAIYGTAVISTADNLIRAYVLHGTAQLHPLIALISVLGAMQVVGLWGVFVGPIVAAFFYTLLKILHQRINFPDEESEPTKPAPA